MDLWPCIPCPPFSNHTCLLFNSPTDLARLLGPSHKLFFWLGILFPLILLPAAFSLLFGSQFTRHPLREILPDSQFKVAFKLLPVIYTLNNIIYYFLIFSHLFSCLSSVTHPTTACTKSTYNKIKSQWIFVERKKWINIGHSSFVIEKFLILVSSSKMP